MQTVTLRNTLGRFSEGVIAIFHPGPRIQERVELRKTELWRFEFVLRECRLIRIRGISLRKVYHFEPVQVGMDLKKRSKRSDA